MHTEVVTNTWTTILEDAADEDAEHEPQETQGRYRANYTTLGDVSMAAISPVESNPFDGSVCLRRMKRVLVAACKNGTDGLVTSKELQKGYGEVFFALERVLDGEEGVTTFASKLQEVQPHSIENPIEHSRHAILNAAKNWKEAQEEHEQFSRWAAETSKLTLKPAKDAKKDTKNQLVFDSSWSAPRVKTMANRWTEISYGQKSDSKDNFIGRAKSKGKGKEKRGKGKDKEKEKEKEKGRGKEKSKGKGKNQGKEGSKKEKKPKKKAENEEGENTRSEGDREREKNDKGDALLKKKKVLGEAKRKLSIGIRNSKEDEGDSGGEENSN